LKCSRCGHFGRILESKNDMPNAQSAAFGTSFLIHKNKKKNFEISFFRFSENELDQEKQFPKEVVSCSGFGPNRFQKRKGAKTGLLAEEA
jgi:hypothetical protein